MRNSHGGKMRAAGRRPELERAFRLRSARRRAARRRIALGVLLIAFVAALVWLPHACGAPQSVAVVAKTTPAPPPFKSEIIRSGSPWSTRQVHEVASDASSVFGVGSFPASAGGIVGAAPRGGGLY